MLTFKKWLIENDLWNQAEFDKNLHRSAIGPNAAVWTPDQRKALADDMAVKTAFQNIIKIVEGGKMPPLADVQKTMTKIEEDQNVHKQYLKMPPNHKTGSHSWHETWIKTYDGWLKYLRGIIQKIQNQA